MDVVADTGWRVTGVSLADTWSGRLRGQMGGVPRALLLHTRSVHGFLLRHPLWAVCMDGGGIVLDVDVLERRRVVWVPSTRWVLELPLELEPPPRSSVLTWYPRDGESGGHDRPPRPLFDPDREPG